MKEGVMKMAVKQLELPLEESSSEISKDDILTIANHGKSIELRQSFLKGLIDGLPRKGKRTDIACCFCEEISLILEYRPYGGLFEGAYIFRCPGCKRKFWVAMI